MKQTIRFAVAILTFSAGLALGQTPTTSPSANADDLAGIDAMRSDMIDAFNKNDIPRMLSHVMPDVAVTWQNGELCQGPDQLKAYIQRMTDGPDRIVASAHADPTVTERHLHGDYCISCGLMHDTFDLTNGDHLNFDSRFTATLARDGTTWKIASLHLSMDAFDNDIMKSAMIKVAERAGGILALVGMAFGALIATLIARGKRARRA